MKALIKKLRKFRGISFSLLNIPLNRFDGYGLEFLSFGILIDGIYSERFLFYFMFREEWENGGMKMSFDFGILFFRFYIGKWQVKPELKRCFYCCDLCVEGDMLDCDKVYCSDTCIMMDNMNSDDDGMLEAPQIYEEEED